MSNRGGKPPRNKTSPPKAVSSDPIDRCTANNHQPNERVEEVKKRKRSAEDSRRAQPPAPMEVTKRCIQDLGVARVKTTVRAIRTPANDLQSNRPAKKTTSRREKAASTSQGPKYRSSLIDSKRSSKVAHQSSKPPPQQVPPSTVEEVSKLLALRAIRSQASSNSIDFNPMLYSSGTRLPTPYPGVEQVDSMDCASDEDSLGLDDPGFTFTKEPTISRQHVEMESSFFTSAKLDELRKSRVDNPTAISAMLASHPIPKKSAFPLGTTVGGSTIHDSPSLDGSEVTMPTMQEPINEGEITMQTMEELGIGKDWRNMDLQLLRSKTYPSSLVERKVYSPRDTMISSATKEAREKCLSILQSGRRTLTPAATFPGDNGKNFDAVEDEITEGDIVSDEVAATSPELSEQEASPPSNRKQTKEITCEAHKPPIIIKLNKPPVAASTTPVFFEYNGELFAHAPLASGWKVRVSKSKKRLYYTHPDYGTSWHCPILNPYGHKSSTELVKATAVENQKLADQDVKLDCWKFDADERSTIAGSPVLSIESKVTCSESLHAKNTHVEQTDASSPMSVSTVTVESQRMKRAVTIDHGDLVSLACSEETGEFPVEHLDCCDTSHDGDESRSITTVCIRSDDGGSPSSTKCDYKESTRPSPAHNQDGAMQEVSSPDADDDECNENDDRIAGLTLFDLARGQKQNEDKILPLFASDRVESPSELFNYAMAQTVPTTALTELLSIQASRSHATDETNQLVGTFAQGQKRQRGPPVLLLSRLHHAASPSRLIADVGDRKQSLTKPQLSMVSSATQHLGRSKDYVTSDAPIPRDQGHCSYPIDDEGDDFPSPSDDAPLDCGGGNHNVDSNGDDEEDSDCNTGDVINLELRRTTTVLDLDAIQPKNRVSEALDEEHNSGGSLEVAEDILPEADDFSKADDHSEPSLDSASNTNHSLGHEQDVLVDDTALAISSPRASGEANLTLADDECTDTDERGIQDSGEEGDVLGFAGKVRVVFHPKIVETNSIGSVSTLGKPSFIERSHLTQSSARVLNPPHPLCSLQNLDKVQVAVTAKRKKQRQWGRSRLTLPKTGSKSTRRPLLNVK